ncbi:MAG: hypothetical protein IPH93_12115 [Saprospiraceae bacterium]|nr:hypothetical protein [Saprospiraceae bacterium]
MEATFLYIAAVLSLPLVAAKYKYPALIYGLIILVILNIIRIAGLFLAKIHYPSIFEFLHLHGGVVIFMMISIVMWLIWVQWVMKKDKCAPMKAAILKFSEFLICYLICLGLFTQSFIGNAI